MSDPDDVIETGALIEALTVELRPVRRLARPGWRIAWWLGLVALGAVWLAMHADLAAVGARLAGSPDMWLSVAGSVATAILAGLAAVLLALPDRDPHWALLPLPAAGLWLAASGAGCLRGDLLGGLHRASLVEATQNCLPFIVQTSVVVGIPLGLLLLRARPLRPGLCAWTGGLAIAAASASLLWFSHPFDASLADLLVHTAAVGSVILGVRTIAWLNED